MLPRCEHCGCLSANLQARPYDDGYNGVRVLRYCLVCVVMFDAVCTRHMLEAQSEYLAENARRTQAKRVLLDG